MSQARKSILVFLSFITVTLTACNTPTPSSEFQPSAGVKDIMAFMIDPAADFLWESVSTIVSSTGVEEKRPRTDAEWNAVKRQAVILAESANLLEIPGRHVVTEGGELEDKGTPGNLTAAEAEQTIQDKLDIYLSFAHAMHEVGDSMVRAADSHDVEALVDAGGELDQVCEGCHLQFWYPGQYIPPLPEQFSTVH